MNKSHLSMVSKEDTSCTATSFYLSFDNDDENDGFGELLVPPGGTTNVDSFIDSDNNTSSISEMYKTMEPMDSGQPEDEDADRTPCFEKEMQPNNSTLENISNAMMLTPGRRLTPTNSGSPFRSLTMPQYILREFRGCSTPTTDQRVLGTLKSVNLPGNMKIMKVEEEMNMKSEKNLINDNKEYNKDSILLTVSDNKIPKVIPEVENNIETKKIMTIITTEEEKNHKNEYYLSQNKSLNDSENNKENISPNDSGDKTPQPSPIKCFKSKKNERCEEKKSPSLEKSNGYYLPLKEITRPILKIAKELCMPEILIPGKRKNENQLMDAAIKELESYPENKVVENNEVIQKFTETVLDIKQETESTRTDEIEKCKIELEIEEEDIDKFKTDSKVDEEIIEKKIEFKNDNEKIKEKNEKNKPLKLVKIVEEDESKPSPKKTIAEATKRSIYSRKSLLPTLKVAKNLPVKNEKICINDPVESTEITQLIDQMVKISEKQKTTNIGLGDTVRSLARTERIVVKKQTTSGRASLLPSTNTTWQEKKRYSFTNRMSTVVKTTLNSPARKMFGSVNRLGTTSASSTAMMTNRSTALGTGGKVAIKPRSRIDSDKENVNNKGSKRTEFSCKICKEKFYIKSLFEGHKRSHEMMEIQPAAMTSSLLSLAESASTSSATSVGRTNSVTPATSSTRIMTGIPQCKYCDKKFALVRTLHIHLLQNCNKIPPSEKRKLQFTEMDHEEKAQLPKVFTSLASNTVSVATGHLTSVQQTKIISMKQTNNNNLQKQHAEGFNVPVKRDNLCNRRTLMMGSMAPPPPHSDLKLQLGGSSEAKQEQPVTTLSSIDSLIPQKVANKAHTGIYRTPSKAIVCHLCKLTFKSVLGYTQHNLTIHSNKMEESVQTANKTDNN